MTAENLALGSIFKMQDLELTKRVKASLLELSANSDQLRLSVQNATTWDLKSADFALSDLSPEEMRGLYARMRDYAGARKHYDAIKSNAVLDQCPYCNAGHATTVDHFLPKEHFGTLSIDPWNLVPSCNGCNQILGQLIAKKEEDSPFHPYGDTVPPGEQWLFATIEEAVPPGVDFKVVAPSSWSSTFTRRVERNFDRFKLRAMYQSWSAKGLTLAQKYASRQYAGGKPPALAAISVREFLLESSDLLEDTYNDANHWEAVLYRALADNDWFCTTPW